MVATKEQQKRCKDSCEAARIKKKLKQQHEEELRAEVNKQIVEVGEDDDNEEELTSIGKGGSRKTGPMDQYVHPIDPSIPLAKNKFQQSINEIIDKQRSFLVGQYLTSRDEDEFDPVTGISYGVLDDAMGATEATNPRRSARVRELHEVDEFLSDGEDESEHEYDMDEEIEFESDDDGVMSTKDIEDEEEAQQP